MSYFEYKVIPAPSQRRRRQRRVDGLDKYASTVADLMTEMGLEGWDFIGVESMRERRRRFMILLYDVERSFMIFRRPARLHASGARDATATTEAWPSSDQVRPRRVSRPELVAAVAEGARRIKVDAAERKDGTEKTAEAEKPVAAE